MKLQIIKTENEYKTYLSEVGRLALSDPNPDSAEGTRLELLALLVEDYEKSRFSFDSLDPIQVIQFRMNEQGLRQADLVPYFGSRSRVSEVLARKRPLTVQMVRELSSGLGIAAELLVAPMQAATQDDADDRTYLDWSKFPAKEMQRRGYFEELPSSSGKSLSDLAHEFFARILPVSASIPALARRGLRGDAVTPKARYGLLAWKARVLQIARKHRADGSVGKYDHTALDPAFLAQVVGLSWHPEGIRLACQLIEGIGIAVVVQPHMTGTLLDGAALLDQDGSPVVGLTLRFDRIDYFWFTLLHELAHVMKHLSAPGDSFLDRLEDCETTEVLELEANRVARDTLISRARWRRSELIGSATRDRIVQFAREEKIHPAIVAGRVRRETKNFRVFGDLVGQDQVRRHFQGIAFG